MTLHDDPPQRPVRLVTSPLLRMVVLVLLLAGPVAAIVARGSADMAVEGWVAARARSSPIADIAACATLTVLMAPRIGGDDRGRGAVRSGDRDDAG